MGWWERQAAKSQPIYDPETKEWVEPEYQPPALARGLDWVFRPLAVIGRLGLVVMLLIGIANLEWVWILIALALLSVSITMAWAVNEGHPARQRRRIWWP